MSATLNIRNRSRVFVIEDVPHLSYLHGEPNLTTTAIEVYREEWQRTNGRWLTMWSARRQERLGWQTGRDLRDVLARAALMPAHKKPRWLAAAVRDIKKSLSES